MLKLNQNISELAGIIIGNGNIYNKRPSYVEITGDPIKDREYFGQIYNVVKKELNYSPKIFVRDGAIRLRINNKEFANFLIDIGIPAGYGKFKKVLLPGKIKYRRLYTKHCIRGIIDTDGSVYFDIRKAYKYPYIKIELHIKNKKLLFEIVDFLKNLGIRTTYPGKKLSLYINGEQEVKKYIMYIGFRNLKHIRKINRYYPSLLSFNASVTQW